MPVDRNTARDFVLMSRDGAETKGYPGVLMGVYSSNLIKL